jgi:DNA primase
VIPTGFLQDLLARTDIVEVVGRHVELKRGGANWMGLCPFHTEKSPSFSVSPSKQFYHCFGCGASGDAIRFLTEHLGLSFIESVRDLAGRVGLTVPEEQVSEQERQRRDTLRQRRQTLADVLGRAAAFYRDQLRASPRAIDYLKRRGLTGQVAARFGLGFAPPGWRTLAGVFPQYDDPLLEEAGLVRQREEETADGPAAGTGSERGRYDWFRDRVMFPIRAVSGEVIGFGGRVLDDSKPKYMNSPETPVFSKGRELYGLFEARQALREHGCALVVEGYMDVVALAQAGFPNAVATLGTACTAEHVAKLFRFTDTVVFAFDGDAAGRRAAARALEAALPHAGDLRSVRFLFLPPEHDPDSYVRALGAPAFQAALAQAVPLSRQLLEQAGADCDLASAEGRARMLAQARPLWEALPDGALKRQLLPELARQGQLEPADLAALWGGAAAPTADAPRTGRPGPHPSRKLSGHLARGPRRGPGGRRAPAGPADLALRLLLRHSDWWEQLPAEDHELLHRLGGLHGVAVAWLERQILEHGPPTWAALAQTLHALAATAESTDTDTPPRESDDEAARMAAECLRWTALPAPLADDGQEMPESFDDLQRVLHRLWLTQLEAESARLATLATSDPAALQALRAVHERLRGLRNAGQQPTAQGTPSPARPRPGAV